MITCCTNVEHHTFQTLIAAINDLMNHKRHLLMAIEGRCGAGKSTLADALSTIFNVRIVRMDHFFLRPEQRTIQRLSQSGANIDYERFTETVLPNLYNQKTFIYYPFDCKTMSITNPITLPESNFTIVEGSYSLHPLLNIKYDLSIFLDVPYQEQLLRLSKRNPAMLQDFQDKWIPMENKYFDDFQIPSKCNFIIDNT